MSKKWLIPAIATFALMVSACGNNAAPNYTNPNNTTQTQRAGAGYGADGMNVRNFGAGYNGAGYTGTGFDGTRGTTYGPATYGTGNRTGFGTFNANDRQGVGINNNNNRANGNNGTNGNNNQFFGLTVDEDRNNNNNNNRRDGMYGWGANGNGGYGTAGIGLNGNGYNTFTNGTRPYHAFDDGRAGTFADGRTGTFTHGAAGTHSIYQNQNNRGMGAMQTGMTRLGYSQTNSNQIRTNGMDNVYVDRDALAQAVSNVTASCPGVQRSTVLVTDEEILVGLNTSGNNAKTSVKQAKQNALSVAPRYYKVYVTTDANDIQEMISTASRSSNVSSARTDGMNIDGLIKRMGGKTEREEARTHRTAGKSGK